MQVEVAARRPARPPRTPRPRPRRWPRRRRSGTSGRPPAATSTGARQRWQISGTAVCGLRCSQGTGVPSAPSRVRAVAPASATLASARGPATSARQARDRSASGVVARTAWPPPRQSRARRAGAGQILSVIGASLNRSRTIVAHATPRRSSPRPRATGANCSRACACRSTSHAPEVDETPLRRRNAARAGRAPGAGQGARGRPPFPRSRRDRLRPGRRPRRRAARQARRPRARDGAAAAHARPDAGLPDRRRRGLPGHRLRAARSGAGARACSAT